MTKKIIWSLLITGIMVIGFGILNLTVYQTNQEYAQIAVEQLNDDGAYVLLNSQSTINTIFEIGYYVILVMSGGLLWRIWKPKKELE
jgi:uncharacterized membrane protein YdjX (TVP38/TMEM64 family)